MSMLSLTTQSTKSSEPEWVIVEVRDVKFRVLAKHGDHNDVKLIFEAPKDEVKIYREKAHENRKIIQRNAKYVRSIL